jgi:hypothetical protein
LKPENSRFFLKYVAKMVGAVAGAGARARAGAGAVAVAEIFDKMEPEPHKYRPSLTMLTWTSIWVYV